MQECKNFLRQESECAEPEAINKSTKTNDMTFKYKQKMNMNTLLTTYMHNSQVLTSQKKAQEKE